MLAEKKGVEERTLMQPQVQVKRRRRRRREGEEEEPVLRTTCDNCTSAKVKCNGDRPCVRCKTKGIHCEYTFKKRCGPKRRKGVDIKHGDGEGLLVSCKSSAPSFDDHLQGMAVVLGKDEMECVVVFMQNLNTFLPMTTYEAVKLAATLTMSGAAASGATAGLGSGGANDIQEDEEANQLHHARKALLHGAIAVGAEILEKDEVSITHAGIARQKIKECFDAAVPELVGAYLILALYWIHQKDPSKIKRYIGLAHQSNGIIREPPAELVASLTLISVVLYDAKIISNIGCRVMPPGLPETPVGSSLTTPVARQERVLRILSFVLLEIHNHSAPSVDTTSSTGHWDPVALSKSVDEAKLLLEKCAVVDPNDVSKCAVAGANDMSKCVVSVLQAYFLLLLKNDRQQAVLIAEPITDLVSDNPTVLHLPVVWSMVGCVRTLLEVENRAIAVERLQSTMEPLTSRLGFSSDESLINQELMRVFRKKQKDTTRVGPLPALMHGDMLLRQKAQTSSLNVTAGDYSPLAQSGTDFLKLEPSEAPRRRVLSGFSTSQSIAPANNGHLGNASPLASLMSSPLDTSTASVLASPAPAFRAGALARAPPVSRDSLSITAPLESSSASLMPLGIAPHEVRVVPPPTTSDFIMPGVTANGVAVEVKSDLSANDDDAEALLDDSKLEADRRGVMSREKIQPSFKADAPVSLEQVEYHMAKLGVSTDEGDAIVNRIVTQMDVEAAAELIATRASLLV